MSFRLAYDLGWPCTAELSRIFAWFHRFGMQQRLNEWR